MCYYSRHHLTRKSRNQFPLHQPATSTFQTHSPKPHRLPYYPSTPDKNLSTPLLSSPKPQAFPIQFPHISQPNRVSGKRKLSPGIISLPEQPRLPRTEETVLQFRTLFNRGTSRSHVWHTGLRPENMWEMPGRCNNLQHIIPWEIQHQINYETHKKPTRWRQSQQELFKLQYRAVNFPQSNFPKPRRTCTAPRVSVHPISSQISPIAASRTQRENAGEPISLLSSQTQACGTQIRRTVFADGPEV